MRRHLLDARKSAASGDESWKRLQFDARRRDVVLWRSDPQEGEAVCYFTLRRGRELLRHENEGQLALYLRGCH